MPIRERFQRAPAKKPVAVPQVDAPSWDNEALASWLEGRAYEISSKRGTMTGYTLDEYNILNECARRLRR